MRRYRDPLVVLVLIVLPFVFYVSNSKDVRDHNMLDRVVLFCSAPVQWVVVGGLDACAGLWHRYVALLGVQEQNDALRTQNSALHAELAEGAEMRQENARLRLLVGLREQAPEVKMIFAQVIGTATNPLFRSLRIDRGRRDALTLGAAVVSHDGVVGRVAALGDYHSDVMLLVDNNRSTDVLVQRTRARARVRGQGGDEAMGIDLHFMARTADVEPGDVLITSGLGKTFPKGLRVGKIVSLERRAFGLYQRAAVEPSVDFSRIEAVMVLSQRFPTDATFEASEQPDLTSEGPWQLPAVDPPAPKLPPPLPTAAAREVATELEKAASAQATPEAEPGPDRPSAPDADTDSEADPSAVAPPDSPVPAELASPPPPPASETP